MSLPALFVRDSRLLECGFGQISQARDLLFHFGQKGANSRQGGERDRLARSFHFLVRLLILRYSFFFLFRLYKEIAFLSRSESAEEQNKVITPYILLQTYSSGDPTSRIQRSGSGIKTSSGWSKSTLPFCIRGSNPSIEVIDGDHGI